MPLLYGLGKNGKSVLFDVLVTLLGDYADAAPPGFLMAKPFEGCPTDLAELHGRRVIVCSELKPGDRFDEARFKLLTGGDRLKARRMRQDFFSFEPTHKLWLLGNHRPEVGTGGFAFWRRMRLIPFERVVADEQRVDNLAQVLVSEEGPGILAWLVDGARRYLGGRPRPDRAAAGAGGHARVRRDGGPHRSVRRGAVSDGVHAAGGADGVVSARAFAVRIREAVGLSSPRQMMTSNQRKYYPGIGLLGEHEETS